MSEGYRKILIRQIGQQVHSGIVSQLPEGNCITRYTAAHDWAARVGWDEDIGARRHGGDMPVGLPFTCWTAGPTRSL